MLMAMGEAERAAELMEEFMKYLAPLNSREKE
jgi:hypothetical protein